MKKILYSILLTLFMLFPNIVLAEGGVTITPTSLTIEQGSSKTFTISAYNTIGDISIESKNTSIASVNTNEWITGMVEEKQIKTGTITVTGKSVGTTEINLNISAATFDEEEINSTKTITVNVIPKKSSNNDLEILKTSPKNIEFNSNKTEYSLTVDNNVTELKIDAKAKDTKAKVSGTGTKKLNVYSNTINIVVTAENGSKKTYVIKVTRKDEQGNTRKLSSDNNLSSITVEGYEIQFDSNKETYYLDVEENVTKVNITAKANDKNATVKINDLEKLQYGENLITIDVLSETGETKTYKIIINRDNGIPKITIDKLLETLDKTESDTVIVEIRDENNAITKEMLEKVKLSNKKLIINKYQGEKLIYSWELDSKDIKQFKDINTKIQFYSSANDKINELTEFARYSYFKSSLDTSIFSNITLKLYMDNEYSNENLYLYSYDNEKLEKTNIKTKNNNQNIEINNIKPGEYVLTQKELNKNKATTCIHKTLNIIELIIIIILIITLIMLIIKKQKRR